MPLLKSNRFHCDSPCRKYFSKLASAVGLTHESRRAENCRAASRIAEIVRKQRSRAVHRARFTIGHGLGVGIQ
jgi:hypothetical protein